MKNLDLVQFNYEYLDHLPIGIVILSKNYKVIYWNSFMETWANISKDRILGNSLLDFFPDFNKSSFSILIEQIFEGGPPVILSSQLHKNIFTNSSGNSSQKVHNTYVKAVPSLEPNEYYALFSVDDVTALTHRIRDYKLMRDQALEEVENRKKAESALKESEKKLIELNATKDKFFSIIAHDLKNPIGAFMNVSELLANMYETFSKEEILEILHEINSYAKRLFSLLENLLIWSKSQTGKIEIDPDLEKLDLVVSNCISILDLSAENKNIKLINEVDPNIVINADINMITTVIRNLMSNSIKYTMPGGEVKVSAVKDTKFVEVVVSDSGIGMSPETIGKLFRIDQHHTTPGTSNEKGTGLGLILCKEFVEKHNGRIWVTSVEDKGSEFHFTVPMKEDS
jgi:signal transduction histidine kinase